MAIPVCRHMDFGRSSGSEPAAGGTNICAHSVGAVRRVYSEPGWKVLLLVPATTSAGSRHRAVVPRSEFPKLSLEPRDVLYGALGSTGVFVPDSRGFHSRRGRRGRQFKNLGGHSLSNGYCRGQRVGKVCLAGFYYAGPKRWFAIVDVHSDLASR